MKRLIILFAVMLCVAAAFAQKFSYRFNHTPLADALVQIAEQHPDIHINFIYNELDKYPVTVNIHTDNAYNALRQLIGLNPVSVISSGNRYYIEALQHGKFCYTGKVISSDKEPVVAATVMLLAPKDSTVITYGVADADGRFSIPCDRRNVIAMLSCMGYKTVYHRAGSFNLGTIVMQQKPLILNSVTKKPDYATYEPDKYVYIPTSRQKNSSRTAIDLLQRMAIPQLVLTPGSNEVQDVAGNTVPVYINYQLADEKDLRGLNMSDVRKVEFIENPSDTRFRGALGAVNIIVQLYEYGGYIKTMIDETCLNGFENADEIFSRFTYKRVTYDLYTGFKNNNFKHIGSDTYARYSLENNNDKTTEVLRDEVMLDSHRKSINIPLSLRVVYNGEKFEAVNTVFFTHSSTPTQYSTGNLTYHDSSDKYSQYTQSRPEQSNSAGYSGSFWGSIGKGYSLEIAPRFNFTHRNINSDYSSGISQPINYNINEDAYNWSVQVSGSKRLGDKHRINLGFSSLQYINDLIYRGSDNFDDSYKVTFAGAYGTYRFQSKKLFISAKAGFGYEYNKMNEFSRSDIYPYLNFNAGYSINDVSRISGYLYLQNTTPDLVMKASDVIRVNELMYYTANPDLRIWHGYMSNLAYNWYHKNIWRIAAFGGYDVDTKRVTTIYEPYNNGNALIRKFINNGNYERGYLGASVNFNLLDGNLQLYANLSSNMYRTTGIFNQKYYTMRVQLQASYYLKNFSALAYYASPNHSLTENSNVIIRGRNNHGVQLGWGNGTWLFGLKFNNFFNKGWRSSTWERITPLYSEKQVYYSPSSHPNINISVTYTIGYGKKIRRGNEVGEQQGAGSAILK